MFRLFKPFAQLPFGYKLQKSFFPPPLLKKRLVIVCARALSPTPPHLALPALPVSSTHFFFFTPVLLVSNIPPPIPPFLTTVSFETVHFA